MTELYHTQPKTSCTNPDGDIYGSQAGFLFGEESHRAKVWWFSFAGKSAGIVYAGGMTAAPPYNSASGLTGANVAYVAPPFPYSLPADPMNTIVAQFGQNLGWCKSHTCPCVGYGTELSPAGSPNPACTTCDGRGIYWDDPVQFVGLLTFAHHMAGGVEPGADMNVKRGQIIQGEPWVTITQIAGNVWEQASEFDIFIENDAVWRMNSTLISGASGILNVPYQQNLSIAATGAVTTWDLTTSAVVSVTGYTVSGASVILPAGYPDGTPYVVEFESAPSYVAFRSEGGFPHTRPFVQGTISFPKRLRLKPLDLWLRENGLAGFGTTKPYG